MLLNCGVEEDASESPGLQGDQASPSSKKSEDEMVGWHHRWDGNEFELTPGVGDVQGSLVSCSPWGRRVRYD